MNEAKAVQMPQIILSVITTHAAILEVREISSDSQSLSLANLKDLTKKSPMNMRHILHLIKVSSSAYNIASAIMSFEPRLISTRQQRDVERIRSP